MLNSGSQCNFKICKCLWYLLFFWIYFRSGIEIVVTELDDLLQQIADLKLEFEKKKKKKFITHPSSQSKSSYLKGYDAREESCSIFIKSTNYGKHFLSWYLLAL